MTPNLYVLILFKIAMFLTISAIVGILDWKIMGLAKKRKLGRMLAYYLMAMFVVLWFLVMGWVITLG